MRSPQQKKRLFVLLQRLKKLRLEQISKKLHEDRDIHDNLEQGIKDSHKKVRYEFDFASSQIGKQSTLAAFIESEQEYRSEAEINKTHISEEIVESTKLLKALYHEEKGLDKVINKLEVLIKEDQIEREKKSFDEIASIRHARNL